MSWKETLVEIATTPWAMASAIAGGFLSLFGLGGVWELLSNVALELFAAVAIGAGTLAPNIDWIPTDMAMGLLVGVAAVVFIVKMNSAIESIRNRYT